MTITRRDSAVLACLVLALIVLGSLLSFPERAPAATPEPTDLPTLPLPVTYREGVVGAPASITPITARSRSERLLVGLLFSGLVRPGPDQTFEPDLARSWTTSDDGLTWTFRIRDDATWQDGVPVTADDVVFTLEALRDPEASGAMSAAWAEVTATALDERTVEFRLQTPIAGFLAAATEPLLPAHLLADIPFADLGTSEFARQPVGSGAFALTELDGTHAVLTPTALLDPPATDGEGSEPSPTPSIDSLATPLATATPGRPVPYLERIEIDFYADDAAAAEAFRGREIDAIAGLPPKDVADLGALPGVDVTRYPTTTLATILLNLRPTHPELRDERVRRALLAAIDRDALVAGALGGDGIRAEALVPPSSWAYDPTSAGTIAYDRKAAAKLLADAGWKKKDGAWTAPGGKAPVRLELLTVPADANPRLAAVAAEVRDAWTALGIGVDLVELPASELVSRLREGTFTASALDITMGLEPDLYPLLASSQVRGSGSNLVGYQDPALDALLEAARKPGTPDARVAAWKALLAGLATRQPMLPLAWTSESVLSRGVEGTARRLITGPGDRFWDVLAWRLAADR